MPLNLQSVRRGPPLPLQVPQPQPPPPLLRAVLLLQLLLQLLSQQLHQLLLEPPLTHPPRSVFSQ